ncbi:hypothetical protein JD969_18620 [Planctomycetota bacterium]|nr:hypothetical protein JD969_18620 [Planctomycetota bacterium]
MRINYSGRLLIVVIMMCCFVGVCGEVLGQTIDYFDLKRVEKMPRGMSVRIKTQSWLVLHSEFGDWMLDGMKAYQQKEIKRYPLIVVKNRTNRRKGHTIKGELKHGWIYGLNRGDTNWKRKLEFLKKCLAEGGWIDAKIKRDGKRLTGKYEEGKLLVVVEMLGERDTKADADEYCKRISEMEEKYPYVMFVYCTMPLTKERDEKNLQRNMFNREVRLFCKKRDKLLFDVADIQSRTPKGERVTFLWDGEPYHRMYSSYAHSDGKLNEDGRKVLAKGWYAVAWAAAERERKFVKKSER